MVFPYTVCAGREEERKGEREREGEKERKRERERGREGEFFLRRTIINNGDIRASSSGPHLSLIISQMPLW
jgi:hypothetical protein